MRDMFTTTTAEEKHSGLWSNPRESLVVLCPLFAKQAGIVMACNAARGAQQDFLECQGRKVSTSFLQNLSHKVAGTAEQQETQWQYDLPNFPQSIASIAISLDSTCMHMSQKVGGKPWPMARLVFRCQRRRSNWFKCPPRNAATQQITSL
jgi:hypothetical protein